MLVKQRASFIFTAFLAIPLPFRCLRDDRPACVFADANSFVAKDVSPPLKCSVGPAGSPSPTCAVALNASSCEHGPGVRGCRKCLGCKSPDKGGCNATAATKAGCTNAEIGSWCAVKSDDEFSGQAASVDDLQKARGSAATRGASAAAATKSTKLGCFQMTIE
jgi:hypothetical protein